MEKQINKSTRRKKNKRLFYHKSTSLGFTYTKDDEFEIEKACREAEKWMVEKYGKGARPHRLGVGNI